MRFSKNRDSTGFTIIEVLIVLAIAGLILLIVFLAVPMLQRNQQNTARKNEASRLLSDTLNFVSSNDGNLPTCTSYPCTSGTPAGANLTTIMSEDNFQYIKTLGIFYASGSAPGASQQNMTTILDLVYIETGYTCGTYNNYGTFVYINPGPTNSIVLIYGLETSINGAVFVQCLQA